MVVQNALTSKRCNLLPDYLGPCCDTCLELSGRAACCCSRVSTYDSYNALCNMVQVSCTPRQEQRSSSHPRCLGSEGHDL